MPILDTLATTIVNASPQILLVALGALVVALALSFLARIAFYVVGVAGTVGALWTFVATKDLILPAILLVGGWVAGFILRSTIKVGAIIVTAFATGLVWLQQWGKAHSGQGWMMGGDTGSLVLFTGDYVVFAGVLAVILVLAMPTILGKVMKGTVKTLVPGGGDKKKEEPPKPK